MTTVRPRYGEIQRHHGANVLRHVAPLYYEGGGVIIKGRTYEFMVSSDVARHVAYDPRKLPVVIGRQSDEDCYYLPLAVARIYRDGYSGGTTIDRVPLV